MKVDRAVPLLLARGSTGSIPLLTLWRMAMGTRDPEQPPLWIAASDLPVSPGHPFYTRLNALLDADGFDTFVEDACRSFYAPVLGRPSLAPCGWRIATQPRNPLRLSSLVILGVVARMSRCATRSSYWFT